MYIIPISSTITPINTMSQKASDIDTADTSAVGSQSFADVFKEVFSSAEETQQTVQDDAAKLVMGEIDDLHTVYDNMTKASVALETFVAVKDAALNAYKEVMQISI